MTPRNNLFCLLVCGVLFLGCKKNRSSEKIITEPVTFTKEAEIYLTGEKGDTLAHLNIEIADNDYERETGLMYRKSMQQDQGMLFIFEAEQPRGFYMKNTYIPLDLIFLNAQQKIVHIAKNAQPTSMATIPSEKPAKYVLEVNAGLAEKWNLKLGDSLIFNIE